MEATPAIAISASRASNAVEGSARQTDRYHNRDVSDFDYSYTTPSLFAQDEYTLNPAVTVSASGPLDFHNRYGTFFNPRLSALIRMGHGFTTRISTGTGVFAPTPFTEETEATGLARIHPLANVRAERAWSASGDLGWKSEQFEFNATAFGSVIRHPVVLRDLDIVNLNGPTRTAGTELLLRYRRGHFNFVASHTYTHSTEIDRDSGMRTTVALTPRHTAGFDAMWEDKDRGRVGFEVYYTGRQQLEDKPYRVASIPYVVFGILVERRLGFFRAFVRFSGDPQGYARTLLQFAAETRQGNRWVGGVTMAQHKISQRIERILTLQRPGCGVLSRTAWAALVVFLQSLRVGRRGAGRLDEP